MLQPPSIPKALMILSSAISQHLIFYPKVSEGATTIESPAKFQLDLCFPYYKPQYIVISASRITFVFYFKTCTDFQ